MNARVAEAPAAETARSARATPFHRESDGRHDARKLRADLFRRFRRRRGERRTGIATFIAGQSSAAFRPGTPKPLVTIRARGDMSALQPARLRVTCLPASARADAGTAPAQPPRPQGCHRRRRDTDPR